MCLQLCGQLPATGTWTEVSRTRRHTHQEETCKSVASAFLLLSDTWWTRFQAFLHFVCCVTNEEDSISLLALHGFTFSLVPEKSRRQRLWWLEGKMPHNGLQCLMLCSQLVALYGGSVSLEAGFESKGVCWLPVCYLCFLLMVHDVSFQISGSSSMLPAAMPQTIKDSCPCAATSPHKLFLLLVMMVYQGKIKVINIGTPGAFGDPMLEGSRAARAGEPLSVFLQTQK